MQFKEVIGQQELKDKIIAAIQKNQLPHAIMLLGHEGSGGLPLARAVAQYVMCKNKSETDSCNTCSNCVKIQKLQHPDLHFSFPYSKVDNMKLSSDYYQDFRNFIIENPYASDIDWLESGGNDKQGNITAEECRDILRKLQMRPYESEYKIFIMWYPEYLGNEGKILLKFIEEPTNKTILILVAENLDEVIMTIQSRSQLYPLKRLNDNEIEQALIERHIPEPKARQLARLSDGNFHLALKLTHGGDEDLLELTKKWLNALYQNKGLDILSWVDEVTEGSKELQKNFLLYILQLFEHAIRFKQIGSANMALLETEQKIIENIIGKGLSDYDIAEIADFLNDALYQIERNANTKILFHALSLRIQKIFFTQKKPIIAL